MESWDNLYLAGSFRDAIAYASLIWPKFVLTNGMVFLAEEARVQPKLANPAETLMTVFRGDRQEMERQFNLVEISQLYAPRPDLDDPESERSLAALLATTWATKLRNDFPQWRFQVDVLEDSPDELWIRFYAVDRP